MLEVCPSIAAATPTCEIHPLGIGGREDPVRLVFDAAPGPAFVVGLADLGDRFRLVANEIDVVAPPEPLPHLPVARAVWRPRPDLRTSTEAWLTAGGPHHTVAVHGARHWTTLADLADMLGVELLVIDADTHIRRFASEIRWNQAYYRLAQGLLAPDSRSRPCRVRPHRLTNQNEVLSNDAYNPFHSRPVGDRVTHR